MHIYPQRKHAPLLLSHLGGTLAGWDFVLGFSLFSCSLWRNALRPSLKRFANCVSFPQVLVYLRPRSRTSTMALAVRSTSWPQQRQQTQPWLRLAEKQARERWRQSFPHRRLQALSCTWGLPGGTRLIGRATRDAPSALTGQRSPGVWSNSTQIFYLFAAASEGCYPSSSLSCPVLSTQFNLKWQFMTELSQDTLQGCKQHTQKKKRDKEKQSQGKGGAPVSHHPHSCPDVPPPSLLFLSSWKCPDWPLQSSYSCGIFTAWISGRDSVCWCGFVCCLLAQTLRNKN